MALNSTPRRRFGVALGVVLTGITAGLIGFAGTASAHTPKVSAECKGEITTLNVDLKSYRGSSEKTNSVKITDGETVLEETDFRENYSEKFDVAGDVAHTFTVSVQAWDDPKGDKGWSFDKTLKVEACVQPTSTTTESTETTTPSTETTTETTETTTETPSETAPPSSSEAPPVTTTTTPEVEEEALAETGASVGLPLGIAGVLLVGGVVLLFVVRRRGNKA